MRPAFGDWRSLVAHFVRDEGVGGSNPLSPTKFEKPAQRAGFFAFEAHEDENLRGRGGSTRAKRENVAPATARRASHEVASNPLSPTKFEKPAQRAGFFAFVAHEDENLRGRGGSTRRRPDKTRQRRIRQRHRTYCRMRRERLIRPTRHTFPCQICAPYLTIHYRICDRNHCLFLYLLKSFFALLMADPGIFRCAF